MLHRLQASLAPLLFPRAYGLYELVVNERVDHLDALTGHQLEDAVQAHVVRVHHIVRELGHKPRRLTGSTTQTGVSASFEVRLHGRHDGARAAQHLLDDVLGAMTRAYPSPEVSVGVSATRGEQGHLSLTITMPSDEPAPPRRPLESRRTDMLAQMLARRRYRREAAMPAYTVVADRALGGDPSEIDDDDAHDLALDHLDLLVATLAHVVGPLRYHPTSAGITDDGRLTARVVVHLPGPPAAARMRDSLEVVMGSYARTRVLEGSWPDEPPAGMVEDVVIAL